MKIKFAFFTLLFLFTTTLVSAQYSESELQDTFMSMLADHGIEGWIDSDGDVQFTYNDRNYFVEVNEDDPEFYRVVLFNIWPIESNSEAVEVAFAVDAVNRDQKVAKAYTIDDNVWIGVELFIENPGQAKAVFQRSLDVIESSVDVFVSNM